MHLPRYMQQHHNNEDDVRNALLHPANSKGQKDAWSLIRRKGVYKTNIEALRNNKGKKIVARNSKRPTPEFLPCQYCNGFFSEKTLYKHEKKCPAKIKTAETPI